MPDDLEAELQFRRGPSYADRAYQPCPQCGVPDVVMRDQTTKIPFDPPPLVAGVTECLVCEDLAATASRWATRLDPVNKVLPPGVRVSPRPWRPEDAEDLDDWMQPGDDEDDI